MSINLTDEIEVKTKKGKLGAAKQIFLEGDTQTVENEIQDINSRHNDLSSKHESLSSTVSEHTKQIESNQSQITANKSAQDEKNASLDANMAKLNARDDQITELIKGVTATGGASVATAVTYDNTSSQLTSATVQGAVDELQGSKINKTSISQESGNAEDKVMSQKATTTAIADETTRAKAAEEAIMFDVSANNNGAVFESISALLSSSDLSTLIPTSVRHGGMSIRFILSSDNKYVQYRLTNQNWSIDVNDWINGDGEFSTGENVSEIGIDDEPVIGSDNLVKSSGIVKNYVKKQLGTNIINPYSCIYGYALNRNGEFLGGFNKTEYCITDLIDVTNGQNISANCFLNNYHPGYSVYEADGITLRRSVNQSQLYEYQEGDVYIRFCFKFDNNIENIRANYGDILQDYKPFTEIKYLSDRIDSNLDKISKLENTSFIDNLTVVRKSEFNLVNPENLEIGSILKNDGKKQLGFGTQYAISDYIYVNGQNISCNAFLGNSTYSSYHVFDKRKNFLRSEYGTTLYQYKEGDYFIRFNIKYNNNIENCRANYGNTLLEYKDYNPIYNYISKYIDEINTLQINLTNKAKLLAFLFNKEIVPTQVTNNLINKNGSLGTWGNKCAFIDVSQKQGNFLLFYKDLCYETDLYISVAFYSCDNIEDIGASTFMKGDNLSFRDTVYQIPNGAKWMLLGGKQFSSLSDINDFARWESDSIDDYNILEESEKKKIVCYGDSLTFGIGSTDNNNYPSILRKLINDDKHYSIVNDGKPSALSFDIAARQGGIPYQIKSDITLPADTSSVSVEVNNDFMPQHTSTAFLKNLDCMIAGVECTFDNSGNLHRKTEAESSKTIYAKTPIIFNKSVEYSKAHVQIYFSGTNGYATSVENYVEQIERMTDYFENKNFLIIGIVRYTGLSDNDREDVESALTKRFGSKFINWRRYLLTSALEDAGITPTDADLNAIANGNNPPSLTSGDVIHYNNTGYTLLANLVYQRMVDLGYLN